ncbi:Putative glutamate decarboxylase [Komagataella phaffii CBS 7435]|uniref:Glutamate decarboxylase n=2 Tax=Komagataella phaffii TaxID=460519 RepID=C4R0D8_KOMPG|nr:Hypothetical protein PAS_chr2-1_0343 [Komagataella phaffii GS115]AOA62256.1 GQ67_00382T0 [Komagataella phaffii]CAH2448522.1 Putative glutamate decarboxylase [Komagataella phaffii CBS 7435]AOA67258.1 GQ68_01008T0 [Komagataella phaffii GS115]CAY68962.1 Hypothetical protein PAS_chr2-1_0343 [Komagataella phaffii GS115]CCA38638.1 Putative glutamate decarboxylase [Komagataella phaffii CBS 7435]
MTPIKTDLEADRVTELETLLRPAVELIAQHIKDTDENDKPIGPYYPNPRDLYQSLKLEADFNGGGKDDELVIQTVKKVLDSSVNTWNAGFMDKLYASTNVIGLVSDLLLSALNTNSHVFTVSPAVTIIEKYTARQYAGLFGFLGPRAGGLTFPGGSWSNVTSLQMARSSLYPDTKVKGNGNHHFAVFASSHSHYSVEKACILLGIGAENLFKCKVDKNGCMDVTDLRVNIEKSIAEGYTPLYINATAGTTVFGSYDSFEDIHKIAKEYKCWFHIDGSWGGNVIFSDREKHKMKGSHLADSITANPHKMLGVPCTCSFLLVPDVSIFQQANSLNAPYLFHNKHEDDDENYDLADGTMGCGRRADSLKFYLSWLYYGSEGYKERVDHAFSIARYFTSKIVNRKGFKLVGSPEPACLQVCFYYNPKNDFENGSENTNATRYIATELHKHGKFLVDYSPNPDDVDNQHGEFFRVVFNSPILDDKTIDSLIDLIEQTGEEIV